MHTRLLAGKQSWLQIQTTHRLQLAKFHLICSTTPRQVSLLIEAIQFQQLSYMFARMWFYFEMATLLHWAAPKKEDKETNRSTARKFSQNEIFCRPIFSTTCLRKQTNVSDNILYGTDTYHQVNNRQVYQENRGFPRVKSSFPEHDDRKRVSQKDCKGFHSI